MNRPLSSLPVATAPEGPGTRHRLREPVRYAVSRLTPQRLALGELEPLTCAGTTRLLALDLARVAREEAELPQLLPVRFVDLDERTGDREAHGARLTRDTATIEHGLHIKATECVGQRERLLDRGDERRAREEIPERPTI